MVIACEMGRGVYRLMHGGLLPAEVVGHDIMRGKDEVSADEKELFSGAIQAFLDKALRHEYIIDTPFYFLLMEGSDLVFVQWDHGIPTIHVGSDCLMPDEIDMLPVLIGHEIAHIWQHQYPGWLGATLYARKIQSLWSACFLPFIITTYFAASLHAGLASYLLWLMGIFGYRCIYNFAARSAWDEEILADRIACEVMGDTHQLRRFIREHVEPDYEGYLHPFVAAMVRTGILASPLNHPDPVTRLKSLDHVNTPSLLDQAFKCLVNFLVIREKSA